jgi:hypothetical protein
VANKKNETKPQSQKNETKKQGRKRIKERVSIAINQFWV